MAYDPMDTGRRQRRGCCYCCCGTKKRVCCCLTTLLLTIVAIVLVLYFCIPRKPTFCFTVGYPEDFSATASGVSMTVPVNVSVDNPNYYGFSLDDVEVYLNYNERPLTGATTMVNLASADAPDIHIKRRGNSTVAVLIDFPANSGTTTANANIIQDCTVSGNTNLYINATVTLLKKIHITVPNQQINVNCSGSPVTALVGATAALVQSASGNSTASYFCKKP